MLETPNVRDAEIFPVYVVPAGDDGKRKPFHVLHCLAQPPCDATLRLSPGKHSRLPPECIVKFAAQKGWLADRRGYCLCPEHKPGAAGRPPSDMPPRQKQAAFLAIRDRNLAAAADRMLKPSKPVGAMAKEAAAVRARTEAAKAKEPSESARTEAAARAIVAELDRVATDPEATEISRRIARMITETGRVPIEGKNGVANLSLVGLAILFFIDDHPTRVWSSRTEAAKVGGFNKWTFTENVRRMIRAGFVVEERMKPPASRPFRLRLVDKFDPPAMQPETMESAMSEETVVVAVQPTRADPPPSPTLEANRRIRDYLDGHFDDAARRYCGEVSDAYVAKKLGYPRAWVAAIRSALYGPEDRNEADDEASMEASLLEGAAAALKDDALAIATRAETLEREVRKFLDGRK